MRFVSLIILSSCVAWMNIGHAGADDGASLEKRKPLTCNDTEVLTIKGAHIKGKATGIITLGSCRIDIVDSFIEADKVAIDVRGTGSVTITRSTVYGGSVGVEIVGTANVVIKNSRIASQKIAIAVKATGSASAADTVFEGKRKVTRFAKFVDKGKNRFRRAVKKRPQPSAK